MPLSTLLAEAGVDPRAAWILAEGADACLMDAQHSLEEGAGRCDRRLRPERRSLRPEQGYPLRLVLPGCEGNTNVKWLRRIKVGDQPW